MGERFGGRSKGTVNRNKAYLMSRLADMYGDDFHPIMKIAANCVMLQKKADALEIDHDDKVIALQKANAEWARISESTEPKLKAIEVIADIKQDVDITSSIEGMRAFLKEHGIDIEDL